MIIDATIDAEDAFPAEDLSMPTPEEIAGLMAQQRDEAYRRLGQRVAELLLPDEGWGARPADIDRIREAFDLEWEIAHDEDVLAPLRAHIRDPRAAHARHLAASRERLDAWEASEGRALYTG